MLRRAIPVCKIKSEKKLISGGRKMTSKVKTVNFDFTGIFEKEERHPSKFLVFTYMNKDFELKS